MIAAACLALVTLAATAPAADRHSNGIGGGPWSDPESWRGRAAPGPTDLVVIATGDTIAFDAHHPQTSSCAGILLDPQAALEFKADSAPHTLTVAGPIESYGAIRLDASRAPQARLSLVLAAPAASNRVIRLLRNSSFLASGAAGLPDGGRNITLAAGPPAGSADAEPGTLLAKAETILELNRVLAADLVVSATGVDNTGFKPNERLNLVDSRFTGNARVAITYADTPAVRRNVFDGRTNGAVAHQAVYINVCKLAQIEGNVVTGLYASGLLLANDTESLVADNTVDGHGATRGIYVHGRSSMLRRNILAGCAPALYLDSAADAVVEDTTVSGGGVALAAVNSSAQITTLRLQDRPETNTALTVNESSLTLLNTPIQPDQVRFDKAGSVTAMDYVVARVAGKTPDQTAVELRTAAASGGPPKGSADLNVRNTPATLSRAGLTPLPASGRALVVKSWTLTPKKKTDPPFYDLIVVAPPGRKDGPPQTLKSLVIEPKPAWFRADPNAPAPTVEVPLP